ncbi:GntR family transcriptional regulator [Amycolatopsis methanolica]|uniref:GntR family transcriptional regulator n=1 Tax=Amycolatopsis methanolica TaxID=1814 RepID=UPI0034314B6A
MIDTAESSGKPPASRQVAEALRAQIEAGEYPVGSPLPPYRQLASEYDVAVNTAIAAVRLLRDQGFVTIKRNAGARVRDRSADVSEGEELLAVRDDVAGLQSELAGAARRLADIEKRLTELLDRQAQR